MMSYPLAAGEGLKALWEVTAGPWPGFEPLRGGERCDVAVIGGGFTGLAAALTGSSFHYGGMIERRAGAVQPLRFPLGGAREIKTGCVAAVYGRRF
jgi:hypothetical protein